MGIPKWLCLCVLMLSSMAAFSQDTTAVNLDDYVEQLNNSCPIKYGNAWAMNSFTMVGDRYVLVDVQMPSNLSMFLSTLTEDTDNVKQMWIRQLKLFGKPWKDFVDTMVENDRRIVVHMQPLDVDESALVTFLPSDFKE